MIEDDAYTLFQIRYRQCLSDNPRLQKPLSGLDDVQKFALCFYSNHGSGDINLHLRQTNGDPTQFANLISALDRALAALPKFVEKPVTRMLTLSDGQIGEYQVGNRIIWHAYSGSSSEANLFKGNVRFIIKSKSGRDIHNISGLPSESEVLFPRDSIFEVKPVKKSAGVDGATKIVMDQLK